MPQLDPSSFISQLFWLVITFGLLYVVLSKVTLPQISRVLQNRQTRITTDVDKAESMRKEAEKVRAEYEAALSETRAKSMVAIMTAKAKAEEEAARKRDELDKVIQKKLSDADKKMQELHQKVMADLEPMAEDLAMLVVKQVTGKGTSGGPAMKERAHD
jgi:F-type H+-transporting ATPase subunit b